MVKREQIVAEVAEEWARAGKLHDPPDDTSSDDDLGFWAEVERRGRSPDTRASWKSIGHRRPQSRHVDSK